MKRLIATLAATILIAASTTGCATNVAQWIVSTRNHQGDVALSRYNYQDASVAYQLALKVDPANAHARAGLVSVQTQLAQTAFAASRFDDAIDSLTLASKYSPQDERIVQLRSEIEQAQIKRDIVVTNYPAFRETGAAIRRSYDSLKGQSNEIALALRTFNYTYDTNQLTKAIRLSYGMNADIARYTNRLSQFRQLVESGVPESTKAGENLAPPASLLPLP